MFFQRDNSGEPRGLSGYSNRNTCHHLPIQYTFDHYKQFLFNKSSIIINIWYLLSCYIDSLKTGNTTHQWSTVLEWPRHIFYLSKKEPRRQQSAVCVSSIARLSTSPPTTITADTSLYLTVKYTLPAATE